MKLRLYMSVTALVFFCLGCYHPPEVRRLRNSELVEPRTLFVAMDGVDYNLIKELHDEGHFRDFLPPVPFVSTFPSDTTVGFTGIMQPLNVGKVPGYEVRFYSYKDNKVIGGTPFDIYKIPIHYKYYFDTFRHQMQEKAIMYMFPGLAGKQDLVNTEQALYQTDKKIILTYIGGTDGFAHVLGRERTKRFLIFMDEYLQRLQRRYQERKGEDLRIILFSDHGFHHHRLKTISLNAIGKNLRKNGFHFNSRITSENDIVPVTFGLLSAGVFFTAPAHRSEMAADISATPGIDLVFWHQDKNDRVFVRNSLGASARFEFKGTSRYRYIPGEGDPLGYVPLLAQNGFKAGQWLSDSVWKKITFDHRYPDAGYRLYDAFFNLVENPASIMISTLDDYQFGSIMARVGTWAKLGHKGTHGGLFRDTTWGVAMTNENFGNSLPSSLRYDELFHYFLPQVTRAYKKSGKKKEVTVIVSPGP